MEQTRDQEKQLLLSVQQTAHLLNVGERLIWKLIENGDLSSIKLGSRRLIPRQALESLLERSA